MERTRVGRWLDFWDGRIPVPAIIKPKPLWTGKQIMTMILPSKINVRRTANTHPDEEKVFNGFRWTALAASSNHLVLLTPLSPFSPPIPPAPQSIISPGDTRVLVEDGELLTGILDKSSLGTKGGGFVHVIWRDQVCLCLCLCLCLCSCLFFIIFYFFFQFRSNPDCVPPIPHKR